MVIICVVATYYRFNEKVSIVFLGVVIICVAILQIQREGQYCVPGVVIICVVTIRYRFNEKVSTVFLVF